MREHALETHFSVKKGGYNCSKCGCKCEFVGAWGTSIGCTCRTGISAICRCPGCGNG